MRLHFCQLRTPNASVPIDELLKLAKSPRVKSGDENGQRLLQLSFEYDDFDPIRQAERPTRIKVWFNKDRNYHVQRLELAYGPGWTSTEQYVIREFVEYDNGRFFPTVVECDSHVGDERHPHGALC